MAPEDHPYPRVAETPDETSGDEAAAARDPLRWENADYGPTEGQTGTFSGVADTSSESTVAASEYAEDSAAEATATLQDSIGQVHFSPEEVQATPETARPAHETVQPHPETKEPPPEHTQALDAPHGLQQPSKSIVAEPMWTAAGRLPLAPLGSPMAWTLHGPVLRSWGKADKASLELNWEPPPSTPGPYSVEFHSGGRYIGRIGPLEEARGTVDSTNANLYFEIRNAQANGSDLLWRVGAAGAFSHWQAVGFREVKVRSFGIDSARTRPQPLGEDWPKWSLELSDEKAKAGLLIRAKGADGSMLNRHMLSDSPEEADLTDDVRRDLLQFIRSQDWSVVSFSVSNEAGAILPGQATKAVVCFRALRPSEPATRSITPGDPSRAAPAFSLVPCYYVAAIDPTKGMPGEPHSVACVYAGDEEKARFEITLEPDFSGANEVWRHKWRGVVSDDPPEGLRYRVDFRTTLGDLKPVLTGSIPVNLRP